MTRYIIFDPETGDVHREVVTNEPEKLAVEDGLDIISGEEYTLPDEAIGKVETRGDSPNFVGVSNIPTKDEKLRDRFREARDRGDVEGALDVLEEMLF